jgi:flagellar assembly protein FliH
MSEPTHTLWELPQINGPVLARSRRLTDLDAIEREAWEQGLAAGREAGIAAVQAEQQVVSQELDRRVQQLGAVLEYMSKPIAVLDGAIVRQIATLAGAIARQIVRRELKTHPDEIVAVVRETVALLPIASRDVRVHLNPEDAALVRSRLAEATGDRAWSIVEDPVLSRGGCRVSSENSTIDAQLEARLGAAIAAVLGDNRSAAPADAAP